MRLAINDEDISFSRGMLKHIDKMLKDKKYTLLLLEGHIIREHSKEIYTVPSKLIESIIDNRKNYIHVLNLDGNCEFIRYSTNRITDIFNKVIKKYNVKVIDEYGIDFTDYEDSE